MGQKREGEIEAQVAQRLLKCLNYFREKEDFRISLEKAMQDLADYYEAEDAYLLRADAGDGRIFEVYHSCHQRTEESKKWQYGLLDDWKEEEELFVSYQYHDFVRGILALKKPGNDCDIDFLELFEEFIVRQAEDRFYAKKLHRDFYYDELTGVNNRRCFMEKVRSYEMEQEREVQTAGIVVADILELHQLNDKYGAAYGDKVLVRAAEILRQCFGRKRCFRTDGDEFVILCIDMEDQDFEKKVRQLQSVLEKEEFLMPTGAVFDIKNNELQALTETARHKMKIEREAALILMKQKSKQIIENRRKEIKKLIEQGAFVMYLQPKVSTQTRRVVGAEALVRMQEENGEILPPNLFVPELEKNGLIRYIDYFMLKSVCQLLEKWYQSGHVMYVVSLNFSRNTLLSDRMLDYVDEVCSQYEFPKEYLEIEVTESMGEYEQQLVKAMCSRLKNRGYHVTMDDFGSKYSNLCFVSSLHFDGLKLDKNLILDIDENLDTQIMITHVIDMCHQMGIYTVAEGVETEQQFLKLKELNCELIQGYLFGKPMSVQKFESLLKENG